MGVLGQWRVEIQFRSKESEQKNNIIQFYKNMLYNLLHVKLEKTSFFNKTTSQNTFLEYVKIASSKTKKRNIILEINV